MTVGAGRGRYKTKLEDLHTLPRVEVEFEDHCQSSEFPLPIKALGLLLHKDAERVVLISWLPLGGDQEFVKNNWELFTLVTSAITKITYLSSRRNSSGRRKARSR